MSGETAQLKRIAEAMERIAVVLEEKQPITVTIDGRALSNSLVRSFLSQAARTASRSGFIVPDKGKDDDR